MPTFFLVPCYCPVLGQTWFVYLCCVTMSSLLNVSEPQFPLHQVVHGHVSLVCEVPTQRGRLPVDGVRRDGKGSVLHSSVPGGRSSVHTAVHLLQTSRHKSRQRARLWTLGAWHAVEVRCGVCLHPISIPAQQWDWQATPVSPEEGPWEVNSAPVSQKP